jgi:hypothetical protein
MIVAIKDENGEIYTGYTDYSAKVGMVVGVNMNLENGGRTIITGVVIEVLEAAE